MNRAGYSCYCEGPFHTDRDCPVFLQAWEEREHAINRRQRYMIANHVASYSSASYHQPPSSNSRGYYQSNDCYQENYNQRGGNREKGSSGIHVSRNSKYDALINMLKEMKKADELRDKKFEALVKQFSELAEDVAQIRRNQDELHNDVVVVDDIEEEFMDLPEQENRCLNLTEGITALEKPLTDEIQVHPDHHPISITLTNNVGDEGSRIRIRKVGLQEIGQFIIKWPRNNSFSTYMPIIVKLVLVWHMTYRAFVGNSVGKCSLRPP